MIELSVDTEELISDLEKDLQSLGEELDLRGSMGRVAVDQLARIKTRTLKGADFEETAFAPYSKSYAAFRIKKGHPADKVDLFFRGHMLGAMDWEAIEGGVRLFFNDTTQAAKAHGLHYGYKPHKLPARPFFEVSEKDVIAIREQLADEIEEIRKTFFSG